jgi:hypothetical protein
MKRLALKKIAQRQELKALVLDSAFNHRHSFPIRNVARHGKNFTAWRAPGSGWRRFDCGRLARTMEQ